MSYIDKNLLKNETLVYKAFLHWIIFTRPFVVFIFIYLVAFFFFYNGPANLQPYARYLFIPLALNMFYLISKIATFLTTEFGVTNQRVITKKGFLYLKTSENYLQRIADVEVFQDMLGKILGYGSIVIIGTGGTYEQFDNLADPLTFRRELQTQVERVIGHSPHG